jgi:hypothetical protein
MTMSALIRKLVLLGTSAVLPIAAFACDDGPTADPGTGRLVLHTVTTGSDVDPDGYSMRLDGGEPIVIPTSGSVDTAGLTAGNHQVEIGDIAQNCEPSDPNPLAVSIQALETTEITFEVNCIARTGVLQIRTFTNGSAPVDGFVVWVDGAEARSIEPDGGVAFSVAPGEHQVLLDVVTAECVVDGANPRPATVGADEVEFVTFLVNCEGF